MGDLTITQLFDYASKLGVLSMFSIFVYGGFKQWWVWGYQLDAAKKDCDFYREGHQRLLEQLERALMVAEKKV